MSKLEKLISELCPYGVEYKKLGDIATIFRGGNLQKKDFTASGIPCLHYGQIYTRLGLSASTALTFIAEEKAAKLKYANVNDIIMAVTSENIEDVCKCVAWLGTEPIAVSGHTAIIHHEQNTKFLAYYFHSAIFQKQKIKLVHGTKVMEVTPSSLNDIMVPLPPLPVQEEIARVLDGMDNLIGELQHELEQRKKQYKYYTNQLLNFSQSNNLIWKCIGDICINKDNLRKPIKKSQRVSGQYPYYGASGIVDYVDDFILSGNYLLVSEDGANLVTRNTPIAFSITGKNWVNNHAHILEFKDIYIQKFVEYYLNHLDLSKHISAGAQPKLTKSNLNNIRIPVLAFNKVKNTVNILDRFDMLCNDQEKGLPAEIALRQKQYEYYRDKMLSFKEKKNE